jgi:endonuclease/exonuclease/phosphatase family metal-dependent hydrolase
MKQIALVLALITLSQYSVAVQTNVQVKPSLKNEIINLKKDPALFSRSYESVINKLVPLNALIPAIEKQTVRIMSYNVHRFSNAHKKPTEHEMVNIIQTINPTIVILQEAENNHPIIKRFKELGYNHHTFAAIDSSEHFGNMILSKIPFKFTKTYQFASNRHIKMGRIRNYIKAEIDLSVYNKKNLVLYATHLAIYTQVNGYSPKNTQPDKEIRLEQTQEIIGHIKAQDYNKNVIIAGDFNDDAQSDVWQYLLKYRFTDCLSSLDTGHLFTSLYGQRIDFIKTRLHDISLIGCYMYFSSASDHLPIFVDLAL